MNKGKNIIIGNYISIDLEIHPENNDLLKFGAVASNGKEDLSYKGRFDVPSSLRNLDEFCTIARLL